CTTSYYDYDGFDYW
nr:immunoglobulin heavy chain junction region [Mus musculus]